MSNGSAGSSGGIRPRSKPFSTDVPTLHKQLEATIREREHLRTQTEEMQQQLAQMDTQHLIVLHQQEQRINEMQLEIQSLHAALHTRKDRDGNSSGSSSSPSGSGSSAAAAGAPMDPRLPQQTRLQMQRLYTELAASQDVCKALTKQMQEREEQQRQQDQLHQQNWMENLAQAFREKEAAIQRAQQLEMELQEFKARAAANGSASIVLPAQQHLEQRQQAETPSDAMQIEAAPIQPTATKSAVPLSEPLSRLSSVESTDRTSSAQSVPSGLGSAAAAAAAFPSVAGMAIESKTFRLPSKTKAPIAAQSAAAAVAAPASAPSPQPQLHVATPPVTSPVPASPRSVVSPAIPAPPETPHFSAPFATATASTMTPVPRAVGRFILADLKKKRDASALQATTPSNKSPRSHIDMANDSPISAHTTPSSSSSFQSPAPSSSLPPHSPALQSASSLHSAASTSNLSDRSAADSSSGSAAKRPRTIPFQLSPRPIAASAANSPDIFEDLPQLCR